MDKDKDLDNIFKKGLQDPAHSTFMADDWDAMEKMLDKHKKRPAIIYWLPVISSVAALLLLFIGWWLFKPVNEHPTKTQQTAFIIKKAQPDEQKDQQKNTGKSGGAIQQMAVSRQNTVPPAHIANNLNTNGRNLNNKPFSTSSADGGRRNPTGDDQNNDATRLAVANLLAFNPKPVIRPLPLNDGTIDAIDVLPKTTNTSLLVNKPVAVKSKPKSTMFNHPQFALNVLASSDLNGVNSLQQTKVGDNFGLMFSASVFKKFTITTGAVYSAKPYMTGFENYHTTYQFKTEPLSVQADCRMLDIPLNIDYQVYNHYQNKISIGTGISSYLMLHESYTYNYAEYGSGPASYNVPNPGKYFFSALNLQATYERQINSKFGITIEPYAKLPLSTVGVSQVRLQTTGVALGLKWNLNSLGK